jgi:dipeptidyl aminopeptidase/acylaminoacyl peptidase
MVIACIGGKNSMSIGSLDRRRFLRHAGVLAAGLPLVGLPRRAFAEPELPARRVFFDNPDYSGVSISPDGQHLTYQAPVNGVRNLWLAPVDQPQAGRQITRATGRSISTYYRWAHTNRHLVFFQDRDGDENWRASSVDIVTGIVVPLTPEQGVKSELQEVDYRFPEEMLLIHNERDKRFFDLYRINVVTGKSELLFENPDYGALLTDGTFHLRLASRMTADGSTEYFERQSDRNWKPFTTVPLSDLDSTDLLTFSDDGKILYMIDSRGRDKAALFAVDMATRERKLLAEDDEADIISVEFEPKTRRPLAAYANKDRLRWHPIDPSIKEDLTRLASFGPGDIEFTGRSIDGRKAIASFNRDSASGEAALIDRATGKVQSLYKYRPALEKLTLAPMQPVAIPARDGLSLNGYLTMPAQEPGAKPTGLPLVLVIHGGPYARDYWGFNGTHQWLASRGYAVLSINYRGSTGFGKAFVTAADREWGGKMHDDLIDGVNWAIGRGFADPKRVGFYGGSYGGYSALVAATKTPEVFACIVDLFGISNLLTFMDTIPPYWGPWVSIWKNRVGDPGTEAGRAFLRERSPLTHIDRVTRPLLIAQGMQDVRVVAAESEQMVNAMKSRGIPVTYVTFPDEGHGFIRPQNRLAFFALTEAFLAKHLGGRFQPAGDDFAGSSIKFETGAELIPGLAK